MSTIQANRNGRGLRVMSREAIHDRQTTAIDHKGRGKLVAQILTRADHFSEFADTWNALHAVASPDNPFNQWTWVYYWWQAFGRLDGWVRDRLQIHVQRDADGIVRGIVPLVLTSFGWERLAIRKLRLFGS